MSLWTPGGEHPVGDDRPTGGVDPGSPPDLDPQSKEQAEAMAREMAEVRQQLASVPAAVVVANHAMGLYELAAIHLSNQPPNLPEAKVAIDAFAALLDAVADRLGDDGSVLTDALAQIRLAFVQVSGAQQAGEEPAGGAGAGPDDGVADTPEG